MGRPKRKRKERGKTPPPAITLQAALLERDRVGRGSATLERIHRAGGDDHLEVVGRELTHRVLDDPLQWCWAKKTITAREYAAGDQLGGDYYLANVDSLGSIDWNRVGGMSSASPGGISSEKVYEARQRVRSYEAWVKTMPLVGSVLRLSLLVSDPLSLTDIGHNLFARADDREAMIAAHASFRVALDALAGHYGM